MNRILGALFAALLSVTGAWAEPAADWPQRTITLIVPFPAGTSTDNVARIIGEALSARLGQPIVVENRAGASGALGMGLVAKAKPDGYTLGLGTASTQTVSPSLNPNLAYDPVKDFAPVAMIGSIPYILVVNPDVPAKSLSELIALAKQKPRELTYGSVGQASMANLSTLLLQHRVGIQLTHVPYKAAGQAAIDVVTGRIAMQFSTLGSMLPFIREGKMRAIAVAGTERAAALPDVPTVAESGVPGYEASLWFSVLAPAGTPAAITERLNREINAIAKEPGIVQQLDRQGLTPETSAPDALARRVEADIAKWKDLAAKTGLKQ